MTTTVRGRAPIQLPIGQAWQNLRDLTRAKHYVPGLTDTIVTTPEQEGVGASRIVRHRQFGDMNETVVEWNEGRGFLLRLHRGENPPPPFRYAFFRYALEPAGPHCEIHTEMQYALPLGWLGQVFDVLLLRRISRQSTIDTAVALAEHYRTGEPVPASAVRGLRKNALPT